MAAAPTAVPSSSSSSSVSLWTYDVFLSFRGEDTRKNFTSHLYAALVRKGIETFKDDEKLQRGELISEALEKAIKESKFSVIIFSRNYANSRWCLQELALIMEECCREKHHVQKVFPVFLTGVDPLDVQHQKGSFGEPFREHEKRFSPEMVGRWRSALSAAAQLSGSGWSLTDFGLMATHTVIPSSSDCGWNYDVILNYKEDEETGNNFASNLYASLERANFKTFLKDHHENSKRGEQMISEELKKRIKESRCAIIIFSRNYASSRRCLEELALIMDCRKNLGQRVIPVFLMGVEGSDVRRQKGSFEEPFRKHQECFEGEVVERWRSDLKLAGELCGLNLKDFPNGDEEKLIKKIVKDVSNALGMIPSPKPVIEIPAEAIIIENQSSTQRTLQQMLDCIGDPDPRFGIIGVYGMGGVGKTTLAKEVNNHFEKDLARGLKIPFETVIMVTVSAIPDIRSIQTNISKRLGLQNNSEADALFEVLRKKKFLLILDDVWCELKLEDVGIPYPPNDKGSKILVISRIQDTCTDMGASKTIKVHPLSNAESWKLFVKKAGEHVAADDIKLLAEKIVGRCKGLPLAIVTVARAMANRHGVRVWENALREMKQSAKDLRGMIDKVFVPLKFSFDSLENDMVRSLFLYCASFPEDYSILRNPYFPDLEGNEFLNYCVAEGLADKLGSLKAARDKVEDLIESLKIACMLEEGESKGSVRMHDMMRELALWIVSSDANSSPNFLIRSGASIKEAPQAHEWLDATRILLLETRIEKLPELGETCRKLTTLLFTQNKSHIVIPPTNFFQHMDHLIVLDLSYSFLESLPDSLSCLVKLQVLRLLYCKRLRTLPAVGMLRQLQILDLSGCDMLDQKILGSECMRGVSNLRYLDVRWSKVSILVGVISCLHKLEELRVCGADKIKWRVSVAEDEKWDESGCSDDHQPSIIDVGELSQLTYLTSLSISLEDIIISDWFKPLAKKIMWLSLTRCRVIKQEALEALNEAQNLQDLCIEDCSGVTSVRIATLHTTLINCEDLELVWDHGAEFYHRDSFTILALTRLPKLKRICVSLAPPPNCFGQLSWIEIAQCNSLKMVFMRGMPRLFNNLTHFAVTECDRMEVIIEAEEEDRSGRSQTVSLSFSSLNHGADKPLVRMSAT
ncbi:disease resistance protein RPS2-like [Telopea speciosissima]|uniref:disease resistance protein RPS2-like n=1 Tax=Telopea speciosissima TaxID=54955 RepID=UPI001CC3523A|nr:disease resistance protein RPS2-like [Telopea speciosissima]